MRVDTRVDQIQAAVQSLQDLVTRSIEEHGTVQNMMRVDIDQMQMAIQELQVHLAKKWAETEVREAQLTRLEAAMAEMREELNQIKIQTTWYEDDSCTSGQWEDWKDVQSNGNGNDGARGSQW
jgi:cob(I)alamin adenosyltransferase